MGASMNERERIAHRMVEVMAAALAVDPSLEVIHFMPSVKVGRRYVAVKQADGLILTLTLEVEG